MKHQLSEIEKMTLLMHGISAAAHLCGCTRNVEAALRLRHASLIRYEQMT